MTSCSDQPAREKPTIMSAVEASELLGVSRQTLYCGARRGDVPCRRVGRRYVFVREVLVDWLLMRGLDERDGS